MHAHVCWEIVPWEKIYLHVSQFPEIIALIYSSFNPKREAQDIRFRSKRRHVLLSQRNSLKVVIHVFFFL